MKPFFPLLCLTMIASLASAQQPIALIEADKPSGGWKFNNGAEFPGARGELRVADEMLRDSPVDTMVQQGELDWQFNLGQEFPGAKGALELTNEAPPTADKAMRLHADFKGGGGAYVGMRKSFAPLAVSSMTLIRWGPQPLGFKLDPLVQKNVTLQGSFSHNWPIWERVLALLTSGQLDVKPIIGGVWPIDQWHEAFEKMHRGEVVKSMPLT